ncbi:MAG: hypothetical protein KF687_16185 [Cyclobacteriaceae bacterium]|nr:hypothetical protein [Cyclobacteriaceae bacterium]
MFTVANELVSKDERIIQVDQEYRRLLELHEQPDQIPILEIKALLVT